VSRFRTFKRILIVIQARGNFNMIFEVFTAVKMSVVGLRVMTSCRLPVIKFSFYH
jgi:hypothetical protein